MKRVGRWSLILVLSFVILGALVVTVGSGQATASVGNTGVPVRCFKAGAALAPGGQTFLNCVASGGPAFVDGQRVPSGYYLLVMDVLITPDAGTETSGLTDVTLFDAYGTNSRQSAFRLRDTDAESFGFKWSAPYFVLVADHRLEATSAAFSAHGAELRISGLLTTNLSMLPAMLRSQ